MGTLSKAEHDKEIPEDEKIDLKTNAGKGRRD